MKKQVGYLYICALSFCFVLFWNVGIAEAGLLDLTILRQETTDKSKQENSKQENSDSGNLLSGVVGLTEKMTDQLGAITENAGTLLEQTVEATLDTAVEAPSNLGAGVRELLAVDEPLLTVNGLGVVLETVVETVNTVVIAPVVHITETVLNGTVNIVEAIGAAEEPPEPVPTEQPAPLQADWNEIRPETGSDAGHGDNNSSQETQQSEEPEDESPEVGKERIEPEPDTVLEEAPPLDHTLAIKMNHDQDQKPEADNKVIKHLIVHLEPPHAPPDRLKPSGKHAWPRNEETAAYMPVAFISPQPAPSTSNHGSCHISKFADGILSDTTSMRMSGRLIYAKNTRQLISKRGNEPPTPPPQYSFFSNAHKPIRKRSVLLGESNRSLALCDAKPG